MDKIYPVCVPTCYRGFWKTLKLLANTTIETFVYCQPQDYKTNYATDSDLMKVSNFTFITDTPIGVANARNHIIKNQLKRGNNRIFMMDDDCTSFKEIVRLPQPKINKNSTTYNTTVTLTPEEYFTKWMNANPPDCVFSGLVVAGFSGFIKDISVRPFLRIDGKQYLDIGITENKNIWFDNNDVFENLDLALQIAEHPELPCPSLIGFLEIGVTNKGKPSTIFVQPGHNQLPGTSQLNSKTRWAENTMKKWPKYITLKKLPPPETEMGPEFTDYAKKKFYNKTITPGAFKFGI